MSVLTLLQCLCIHVSLSCRVGNVGYIHHLLLGTGMFKNSLCYENGLFCILTGHVRKNKKERPLVFRMSLSLESLVFPSCCCFWAWDEPPRTIQHALGKSSKWSLFCMLKNRNEPAPGGLPRCLRELRVLEQCSSVSNKPLFVCYISPTNKKR